MCACVCVCVCVCLDGRRDLTRMVVCDFFSLCVLLIDILKNNLVEEDQSFNKRLECWKWLKPCGQSRRVARLRRLERLGPRVWPSSR